MHVPTGEPALPEEQVSRGSDLFGTDTFQMRMLFVEFGRGRGWWGGRDDTLTSSSTGVTEKLEHNPGTVGEALHPRHPPLYPYCVSGRLQGLLEMLLALPHLPDPAEPTPPSHCERSMQ